MGYPSFTFKGIKSTDMGVYIHAMPTDDYPADYGDFIQIPGRDGYLYIDKEYRLPITKQLTAVIMPDMTQSGLIQIQRWLTGAGELSFSNEPDIFYQARIRDNVNISTPKGLQAEKYVSLNFMCQPHKYLTSGKSKITLLGSATLINPGSDSKPLITINGSGAVSLSIGSQLIQATITDTLSIDSELMECYKGATLQTFTGPFPVLLSGSNAISWTGTVTSIEVIPRWRL